MPLASGMIENFAPAFSASRHVARTVPPLRHGSRSRAVPRVLGVAKADGLGFFKNQRDDIISDTFLNEDALDGGATLADP